MNTNKENERLNKTFSRITNTDNLSSNTRSSTNNDNKNQKIIVKNFVLSKANPTIINGKNPIPNKRVKLKMQ